jgi:hypothetical protein
MMKRHAFVLLAGLALVVAAASAGAQTPGGAMTQGFNVQTLISQLSLYLPEDSTRGMYSGFGGRGQAGQAAQTGQGAQAGQGASAGARRFPQLQFTRDPKLFLTREQIAALLPILLDLKANPMPTPSKAKTVQASVDAVLTVAQKAEYADFQKQVQKMIADFRAQMAANGGSTGSGQFGGAAGNGQGQGGAGANGGAQMTPLQRRQRQVDAFVRVLQDRQKQLGA